MREMLQTVNKAAAPPQRSSSIRLRRRRDEVKQQFVKNRRSGEFGYRLDTEAGDAGGDGFESVVGLKKSCKDDTLDPTAGAEDHIKHNLRPLIRNKFKLTDFGLIDTPAPAPAAQRQPLGHTGRRKPRESFADDDDEEDTAKMSMNCFSGNIKTLEKENYTSLTRKRAPSYSNTATTFPLHRSLMWVQKGKLLSRWKERFIVITEEYIQCFKKGLAQLSQMGDFIFQFAMKDIKSVSLVDRRGYLTVALEIDGEMAGLVLRKPEGLRDWYNLVQKQVKEAKARVMLSTEQFWTKKAEAGGGQQEPSTEEWLVGRRGHWGEGRPASVASVDRRQHRYRHRHYRQQYGDHPDESSTLSKLSKKSKPRSRSCERERGTKLGPGARSTIQLSARESEDSGNSSLNTYNTDTMGTNTTQYTTDLAAPAPGPGEWVQAPPSRPRGYSNMGWY